MQWVESAVGCGSSCLAMMALGMRCVGMRRLPMVASSFQRIRTAPVSMGGKMHSYTAFYLKLATGYNFFVPFLSRWTF